MSKKENYDSTGAMAAAWFGTPGTAKDVEAIFGSKRVDLPEVVQCSVCGHLHFNPNASCPGCNAGWCQQCFGEGNDGKPLQTPANAAKAYRNAAEDLRKQAKVLEYKAEDLRKQAKVLEYKAEALEKAC